MSAKIYRADAVQLLRSLPDDSVATVLTDPPYCSGGFSESSKWGKKASVGRTGTFKPVTSDRLQTSGFVELMRLVAVESARVLAPGGWLFVFCDWRMISVLQPSIESAGVQYRSLIVWAKPSAGLGVGFRSQHEMVLAFTKGAPVFHSSSYGNVLRCKRSKNAHHTTEKPLELLRPLLETSTVAGDLVVDPFMGSGSTGVAAVSMGRRFVGGDVEQEHLDTAVARLSEVGAVDAPQSEVRPALTLFGGVA